MEPVSLLELNETEVKEFLSSFDHVFSDCDGVIWETNNAFPGAGKFFELMKRLGKTVHFVSNNSLRSRENYEAKFKSADIDDGFEHLTIPSTAIAEYLKSVKFDKTVYCVACPETVVVLKSHGFKCKEGPDVGTYYYGDYIDYLTDDEEIGAVVFDSDFKVNLPKLYKALTYLRRPEVLFISGATDKYVPLKAGVLTLGTGLFTEIASQESKREPILLGKPGKTFGEFAMKRAGVSDPSRVLFIGDMIEQDVGLGRATGFKTLLVLTNKTKEEMMSHETLKPDYYADSLGSIVPILESIAK
ncbi:phosphoglycolate phosphatase 2-like [Maniola jurtina]|uniref:phosphoglycolate phosphatase 2-like n=1 Tax=Maniola jurtina TaxID=191418 RepID=UPI001E689967|nr:phosphoglycolate phosphatase 2-like [Maniola jurtina]